MLDAGESLCAELLVDEEDGVWRVTGWGESEAGAEEEGGFVDVAVVDDLAETNVWLVEGDLFGNDIAQDDGAKLRWEQEQQ